MLAKIFDSSNIFEEISIFEGLRRFFKIPKNLGLRLRSIFNFRCNTDTNVLNAPTFQASHAELTWLNEREDRELTRDWADKNLKLAEVEQYYEVG